MHFINNLLSIHAKSHLSYMSTKLSPLPTGKDSFPLKRLLFLWYVSPFVTRASTYAHPSGSGCQVVLSCAKLDGRRTHSLHFHLEVNAAEHAAQKADTIVNITPVCIHNLTQYVKDSDRQAGSTKMLTDDAISHPTSLSTETLPAEEVEENKELDDGLWDDDDDDKEEENPPKVCMRDCKQHYNG